MLVALAFLEGGSASFGEIGSLGRVSGESLWGGRLGELSDFFLWRISGENLWGESLGRNSGDGGSFR